MHPRSFNNGTHVVLHCFDVLWERERDRDRDRQTETGRERNLFSRKGLFFFFYVTKQASQQHTYSLWKVMTAEQERAMIRKLIKLTCLYNSLLTLKWESNSTMLLNAFNTILTLIFVHQLTSPPQKRQKKWVESLISSTSHIQIWSLIQIKQSLVKCWFYGSPYTFTRNVIYRNTPVHWKRKVIINM